jgi:hypothetical protein
MGKEVVEFLMKNEPLMIELSKSVEDLDHLDITLDNLDQNTDELEMLSKCLRGRIYLEMGEMLQNLIIQEDDDEDSGDSTEES